MNSSPSPARARFLERITAIEAFELAILVGLERISDDFGRALRVTGSSWERAGTDDEVTLTGSQQYEGAEPWSKHRTDMVFDVWYEHGVIRLADTLNLFLADILTILFRSRPEILKSDEKIEYSAILEFSSMETLVAHLAERKVRALTQDGFPEVLAFLRKRVRLEPTIERTDLRRWGELISLRNLYVHRDGVVDHQFVAEVGRTDLKMGQRLAPEPLWVVDLRQAVERVVERIDNAFMAKYPTAADALG